MVHQTVRILFVLRVVYSGAETEEARAAFYSVLDVVAELLFGHFSLRVDGVFVCVIVLVWTEAGSVDVGVVGDHFLREFMQRHFGTVFVDVRSLPRAGERFRAHGFGVGVFAVLTQRRVAFVPGFDQFLVLSIRRTVQLGFCTRAPVHVW